ncbi:MAG TPA: hypothetical protein DHU33_01410 [Firmicutes bacterium]|nr:hypothetical protein [Bacillota bacterium]
MRKAYKIILMVISILLIGSIIIGTSYSMWVKTAVQKEQNIVNSSCFDIEFTESSDINLTNAMPISDEAGLKKKPYTFTLKNTCNNNTKVSIALDVLSTSTMSSSAIKTSLSKGGLSGTPTLLTSLVKKAEVDISGAKEAYILGADIIEANKSKSYSLYLWMDEAVTVAEASKSFNSKVVIVNTATKEKITMALQIADLAETDTTNFTTDDPDNNIRYIGANPNNYVYFNCSDYSNQSDSTCEKWRIIGVFKNMIKEDGSKADLVKIIRDDFLAYIAWDSNDVNDWSKASLQTTLNGEYYNGTYATGALRNDTTRNAIESVVWNLGGANSNMTASAYYAAERGTTVYSGRPTTWTGKIGLMYPSDYGYATSGGTTTNRATCMATKLSVWDQSGASDCKNSDYLYKSGFTQWTLAPRSSNVSDAIYVVGMGGVFDYGYGVHSACNVRPVAFLKSNILISEVGNGSSETPFHLKVG